MTTATLDQAVNVNAPLSSRQGEWRTVAASKRGSRHEASGANCEDAYQVVQPSPDVLVIAVADGAGSASFAEVGANIAAEHGVAQVCTGLERAGDTLDDSVLRRIFEEAMAASLVAVQADAAHREVDYRELASTLILVIAHREFIAAAQIGDGATVIADEAGSLLPLTVPPPTEYINEAIFLTSTDALQTMQVKVWRGRASGVAAFSDGLQMLCMKWPEFEPHAAFFTPLFDFVRNTTDEAKATVGLESFLLSERVGKLTDDDVTLVLATSGINHDDDPQN